ncbi:MAG: magnesium transporter CorA family protein [Micropruina sp.]|nr:magnesium transporter CorA family protein [Micropruina sp.]
MRSIRGRVWRDGVVVAEDFPLEQLDQWLADPTALVWLDVCEPEKALLDQLASELALDPLAVEDAVEPRERPKATRHATHTFITCYSARLLTSGQAVPRLATGRVSVFVLPTGLITVRVQDDVDMDEVLARWNEDGLLGYGVGALVHGLLDTLVDEHFVTIQSMDDALEDLEDLLFDVRVPTRVIQQRVFALRKALVELRRIVLPMREVVAAVMRHRLTNGSARDLDGSFNDLYDHVLRAAEWTESLRDMVSSVFETNLSLQDARLNTIMKKLASWGAIIAVPTAVTGWFGQNLPYPGFSEPSGLWQSAILILIGTVGLFFAFKRFDWL